MEFIPVKLKVKDNEWQTHWAKECPYFVEGVITSLVSLTALKNLQYLLQNFPHLVTVNRLPLSHHPGRQAPGTHSQLKTVWIKGEVFELLFQNPVLPQEEKQRPRLYI